MPPDLVPSFNRALEHHEAGRLPEAIALYRLILIHYPHHAETLGNLGVALQQSSQLPAAIDAYRRALALKPHYPEALGNLAQALLATNQPAAAVDALRQLILLQPHSVDAHHQLGLALKNLAQYDDAITAYRRALALHPQFAPAYCDLGNALALTGQFDSAVTAFRTALSLQPNYPEALNNLGLVLSNLGQLDAAIAAFHHSLALRPDDPKTHCNLAYAHLLAGDYPRGWPQYEFRRPANGLPAPSFSQPLWAGNDLRNQTILLHAEQGFGDTLQFLRYVPLVVSSAAHVIIQVPPELLPLIQHNFPTCTCITPADSIPPFDTHCLLPSLALVFNTTLDSIPANIPYLHANPALIARWHAKLPHTSAKKIGLAWAGSPHFKTDHLRSPRDLSLLAPLASIPNLQFISLQKGPAAQTQSPPPGMSLLDLTADLHDFSETAALIANLDLVITSDTAVAHLAGALGKPVWILLSAAPDWRWLLHRADSPWYPTARLFRQSQILHWQEVIENVRHALAHLSLP